MEYVRLGWSGLKVSRIAIGCMSFGNIWPWMVEKEGAKKVIDKALDLGINFFDTANVYSNGRSEEIVGELLKDVRKDVVIATKVCNAVGDLPNQRGLSRGHIMQQVQESLRRLQTDFIDLYQIHRWDYGTSIEETLSTLNDLVRKGTVRYIGASSMWAWQFSKALYISEMSGFEKFTSMQNKYNLLYREEEREMIPLCKNQNIGIIPYNPMAVGLLAGKFLKQGKIVIEDSDIERLQRSNRVASSYIKPYVVPEENAEIIKKVLEVAQNKSVKPSQIALSWLFHKGIEAPIIGTTNPEHVQEAIDSLNVGLSDEEVRYMEEPYKPKPVSGHS
ncbi:aldo/keto reductase [Candidatus Bathyarchaeota archaeon]|nr:aldo/keto reductase [Candidatus Bathyarchaeota archaeon]